MTTTEAYPRLLGALDDLRRQWRMRTILEGVLLTAAGVFAVLLLTVAADNFLQPEALGRALLALLLWGSLAAGVVTLVVRRVLEDRRDDYFAALVERKHPELHNRLINALQLGRGSQNGFSPGLISAIVGDAATATADLDMASSLDSRPLKRAALCAGVALLLLGGYAVARAPWFGNGLARVAWPFSDTAPYTETQIVEDSIEPGDKNNRFPEGAKIDVKVRVTGAIPAGAQLVRHTADGHTQTTSMQSEKEGGDIFRCTLLQAAESFDFHVTAGDGRSRKHHVEVVKRPQVEKLALTYALPAYTALPEKQVHDSSGEIAALPGTTVGVELRATKALKEASLVTEAGEVIGLERGGDDRSWRGSFVLWAKGVKPAAAVQGRLVLAPARYQIKLVDTEGYPNSDPLWRSITLTRDQAPSVAITAPGRDVQAKPGTTVSLAVEARDDYGIAEVRLRYRFNEEAQAHELTAFPHVGAPQQQTSDKYDWQLSAGRFKPGDRVEYWAEVSDRNDLTGPGRGESRHFTLFVLTPELAVAKLDLKISDYAQLLEKLLLMQKENRAWTASGVVFDNLVKRQADVRGKTREIARLMEKDALPVATIIKSLDDLAAGLMADAVRLLEAGRDAKDAAKAADLRNQSLPVQDKIIAELEAILARLQRNEQAREALRKMEKKDQPAHKQITKALSDLLQDLDKLLKDQSEVAGKFERLPKKPEDEPKEDKMKPVKELEEFQKKWEKWAKGTVNELTKLPTGFVDDFKLRKDVNKVYEEIEKAAQRPKAEKIEVSLEDLGAGLATKMKEDLEMWLADTPDAAKWVLEEPLNKKPMKIPEMPLPKALEDLIGDLLQKADEFDKDADDVTSAWGDNLDQAGWGVSDGPISTFSAKGKTGNDLPNNHEVTGRSGDGRRGKSAGQMVGDTARALPGRKTPARVGNEKYEPGQLKQEGADDPNGATGGGKKSGAGRKGLQGGTPPDMVKDIGRLSAKQAGVREKAEQIAKKLDAVGITSRRLNESIELMKSVEQDIQDQRYDDAARKRRVALSEMKAGLADLDQSTAAQLNRARDLPPQLRDELRQAADEAYPAGYESLLKSYFKALSQSEK
ncbi:MAG TPA: hypothetical protein VKA46_27035 [Gemmataceae bacterium]|nr:hypothetical protein [Gemmataceae bacterium]